MTRADERACIVVFAKPPRSGAVKTRLAPAVGPDVAAQLARAFLIDTWQLVNAVAWAAPKLAIPEGALAELALSPRPELWLQGAGDLGRRLETIIERALATFPSVLALGADTPSLPIGLLHAARTQLADADAVLGPTDDGGFYLLGVKRWKPGLLEGVPWSSADTFQRTFEALIRAELRVTVLQRWFDVDTPQDLDRLRADLRQKPGRALETARLITSLPAAPAAPALEIP